MAPRRSFENVLQEKGLIGPNELAEAKHLSESDGISLFEQLSSSNQFNEDTLLEALAESLFLPFQRDLVFNDVDIDLAARIPEHFLLKHNLVPIKTQQGTTSIASSNPLDLHPLDDLRSFIGSDLPMVVIPGTKLEEIMAELIRYRYRSAEKVIQNLQETESEEQEKELDDSDSLAGMANEAPVIRLVNSFLDRGLKTRASDIHIEPHEHEIRIRYRIDGVLHDMAAPPKRYLPAVVSRIKIMSGLDIAERRLPQDGRIKLRIGDEEADVRVSTVPTAFGERVVLRLLRTRDVLKSLKTLGMGPDTLLQFRRLIRKPNGIVLVCGPTGSGKTTTLYGGLAEIAKPAFNIMTVEDPIEYQIPGISQIQVKPKIDFGFARGLRSILRQDPDIIMVGEIRDLETARMAVQASLTGHLVLSTLHTNDAASAAVRLNDMGVPGYLVSSTLLGALSQRLVRKICSNCTEDVTESNLNGLEAEIGDLDYLRGKQLKKGRGCDMCLNTGYLERTGIYELLTVDEEYRRLISGGKPTNEIAALARKLGMITLRADGLKKVAEGVTTLEEILRVTER